MAIDIKRSYFDYIQAAQIATGEAVTEEGSGLVQVLEDGVEKVKESAGAASEVFVGFSRFRQLDHTTDTRVEELLAPSSAPYELELERNNLIAGQLRVYDKTAAAELTLGSAANSGEYEVDNAAGKLTLNAAESGNELCAYYRYNLTVAQAKELFYEAATNFPDPNFFLQCGVGKGKGQIFTLYYDASQDWAAAAPADLKLAAGGMLTVGGTGPVIPNARVIQVPSEADPHLGIEFNA